MRTLILATILLLILAGALNAREITVQNRNKKFSLKYDESSLVYKDELTELSLIKKACNAHIVGRMVKQLNKHLERPFLEDGRPEFFKVTVDGKTAHEPRFGKRAVFLLSLHQEIKKLKIEENLNCNKN